MCDGKDNDCDGLVDEGNPDPSGKPLVTAGAITTCTDSNAGECAKTKGACVCSIAQPVVDPTLATAQPHGLPGRERRSRQADRLLRRRPAQAAELRPDQSARTTTATDASTRPTARTSPSRACPAASTSGSARPASSSAATCPRPTASTAFGRTPAATAWYVCSSAAPDPARCARSPSSCNGLDDDCDGTLGSAWRRSRLQRDEAIRRRQVPRVQRLRRRRWRRACSAATTATTRCRRSTRARPRSATASTTLRGRGRRSWTARTSCGKGGERDQADVLRRQRLPRHDERLPVLRRRARRTSARRRRRTVATCPSCSCGMHRRAVRHPGSPAQAGACVAGNGASCIDGPAGARAATASTATAARCSTPRRLRHLHGLHRAPAEPASNGRPAGMAGNGCPDACGQHRVRWRRLVQAAEPRPSVRRRRPSASTRAASTATAATPRATGQCNACNVSPGLLHHRDRRGRRPRHAGAHRVRRARGMCTASCDGSNLDLPCPGCGTACRRCLLAGSDGRRPVAPAACNGTARAADRRSQQLRPTTQRCNAHTCDGAATCASDTDCVDERYCDLSAPRAVPHDTPRGRACGLHDRSRLRRRAPRNCSDGKQLRRRTLLHATATAGACQRRAKHERRGAGTCAVHAGHAPRTRMPAASSVRRAPRTCPASCAERRAVSSGQLLQETGHCASQTSAATSNCNCKVAGCRACMSGMACDGMDKC